MKIQVQAASGAVPDGLPPRPRVAAIARDAAEVVRFAGGWLFDQAMAGWDVNVLTRDDGDLQSLRILGAHRHDLASVLESRAPLGKCLRALAIPAELYLSDPGIAAIAARALESAPGELLLWGDGAPVGLDREPGVPSRLRRAPVPVQHRLSFAAQAFKAQAMAATRVPYPGAIVGDAESFRSVSVN
jgi:hypothetical protein